MIPVLSAIAVIAAAWGLAYYRASGLAWSIALAVGAAAITLLSSAPPGVVTVAWIAVGFFALFSTVKPLRAAVITKPVFGIYKRILPQVSQTEQEALDAGSIWWDAD